MCMSIAWKKGQIMMLPFRPPLLLLLFYQTKYQWSVFYFTQLSKNCRHIYTYINTSTALHYYWQQGSHMLVKIITYKPVCLSVWYCSLTALTTCNITYSSVLRVIALAKKLKERRVHDLHRVLAALLKIIIVVVVVPYTYVYT